MKMGKKCKSVVLLVYFSSLKKKICINIDYQKFYAHVLYSEQLLYR